MIITLLMVLIVAAALWWIVSLIPLPQPAKNIAYAVLALVLLLYVIRNVFHVTLP